jgi:hypothetical protein
MRVNLRSFIVLSAVILLGILVGSSYIVLKNPDEEWVVVESGRRTVCKECGKLIDEEIEGKRVKSKDKMKYGVKTIRSLCGICAMRQLGIETGLDYLFEKVKVQLANRVDVCAIDIQDRHLSPSLRVTISKEDEKFGQIIEGIKKSRTEGMIAKTFPDVALRWYRNKNQLIETKYCSIDRRLEVPIEGYPSEDYVIFLPEETGELIQVLLK